VLFAHAALRAAILTVRANCSLSDDQEFIEEITWRVETLETEADETVADILADSSSDS
jgi:formiminotetrahydrofolate cyclodeaminase